MAQPLPTIRNSSQQVLYGSTRIVSFDTAVTRFNNASEQRWSRRPPLYRFILPMPGLSSADWTSWLNFFSGTSVYGRFGATISLTVNGVTYTDLGLESDMLNNTTRVPLRYDQQIRLRQVSTPASWTPPSVSGPYPNLLFGTASATANAEYPAVRITGYYTALTDNPYGQRFSFPWYSGAVSGFPSTYLLSWKLEYPLLTDVDLNTLENYFLWNMGRWGSFTFNDPLGGSSYNNVRFDMDEMAIKYLGPNQNSTTITLRQINGT